VSAECGQEGLEGCPEVCQETLADSLAGCEGDCRKDQGLCGEEWGLEELEVVAEFQIGE
jgi:hypothetical protein